MIRICKIEGCDRKHEALGFCRLYGDPTAGRISPGVAQKYYHDVVLAYDGPDCLIWPYYRNEKGYGRINDKFVHRLACEAVHGPAPSIEHHAAHSCGKGHLGCVAKGHVSWKTPFENVQDRIVHGTQAYGERHFKAKLSDAEFFQILSVKNMVTKQRLADLYGVSHALIKLIHCGKSRVAILAANSNLHYPKITIADFDIDIPRSATFGGFGGNPSIPSFEADGAKMGCHPGRAAKAEVPSVNSKHAATIPHSLLNEPVSTAAISRVQAIGPGHDSSVGPAPAEQVGALIANLSAPSQPKRSDAPGNVFVAPLTLSGATL